MNNVTQNAAQAPKAVAHVATAAPKVAGRQAAQAPTLANKRARSFARAVHRPSYVRTTDPEDCEKGIIGGGKGWRVRSAQEGKASEDEETRIGSEQSSRNEKESDPYDFPATYTKKSKDKEGNEVILLKFVEGDREDPLNWSRAYKWYTTGLLCCMTLFIGLATTSYSSSIGSMTRQLGVSELAGQGGLTTFNGVCAIAPLIIGPLTEVTGRRYTYIFSHMFFVLTFLLLALKNNIAQVLIGRGILGMFGSVGTILVGGTFGDIWKPVDRTVPTALFSYVAIFGTVAAPIYAGFVDESLGPWWQEWIQMIQNGVLLVVVALTLKETRGDVKLKKRAKQIRRITGDDRYIAEIELEARNFADLLVQSSVKAIHLLITEPVLFAFGLWIAFAWFTTFVFLSVIPITFEEKKGWSHGIAGLPYIALCIGVSIAFGVNFISERMYRRKHEESGGKNVPEARLYLSLWLGWTLPGGLFIYSFTQYERLHWIGPCFGLVLIGSGIFSIFNGVYDYTNDSYGQQASSGIAGQGLMRNMLAAVGPLFASQMFHNMGSQYAGLLMALIATLLTPIPFILFKWGPTLRKRSKVASQYTD
ncbi:hypothetical protein FFLO_05185 [Filobasidium floriforme]|uniref:Major facilitator superfamily (MFS) profile domain-containing protein n=1 Tax=Filobasidium floriforme TaxID=5210 RepID=A0A8K0NP28_9TREE|nr:major facilitator superfamily domain-containing protein [Filobasidium floriforme]KAG7530192.1 hypothetical protein FFLO_05185 [Filobasidium floriforme]KAH8081768.1 major facilitator superfamily domain-containing protein [Filobasidium floriforme]